MSTFWEMGGYAGYVWTAYGLAGVVLGSVWFSARLFQQRQEKALQIMKQAAAEQSKEGGGL